MPSRVKVVLGSRPSGASLPTLIIGQLRHLLAVPFKTSLSAHLQPDVTEEVWKSAVSSLSGGENCPLVLRNSVTALPARCSRHAAPARPAALSRAVRQHCRDTNHAIVVVCEKTELYASACAVGRAYPLFSRRSSVVSNGNGAVDGEHDITAYINFLLVAPQAPAPSGSPDEAAWQSPPTSLSSTVISEEELKTLEDAVAAVRLTAKIVDTPTNEMNVDHFLQEIIAVGEEFKLKPKIIRGKELNDQGFGGIYGVGKAAAVPPALAVLSWLPEGATETVAWVGKGIVYDTGGLSIKSKTGMPGMKRDCGGAAAILGAFQAAVRAGFKQKLHAIFCLAENSVGPDSTRPDDIHQLYSGRTVEINNTDAEGRLVLADGVAYAQKDLGADIILDMATLTGAQGIAVGKHHAAVLSNSAAWEGATCVAGRSSGDLAFPVPYAPELHFTEFASALADMKNSVADRNNAQVSCAGLFIGAQMGWDFPGIWVHVDMADPSHCGERATGYGVALLSVLFGSRTTSGLLGALAPPAMASAAVASPPSKKPRHN